MQKNMQIVLMCLKGKRKIIILVGEQQPEWKEMDLMSETGRRNREEEYADSGRENWSAFEETYRDGSLKNECWNSHPGTYGRKNDPDQDDPDTED